LQGAQETEIFKISPDAFYAALLKGMAQRCKT